MTNTYRTDDDRGYGPDDADRDQLVAIIDDHKSGHHDDEPHGGCPRCLGY